MVVDRNETEAHFRERNAALVQLEEYRYNYYFPVSAVYLLWLKKAVSYFREGDPRRQLLISGQNGAVSSLKEELNRMTSFGWEMRNQMMKVKEEMVETPEDIGSWDQERLVRCLEGWRELKFWGNWYPQLNPFFAVLPRVYPDLPRFISLGDEPHQFLQRRFDKTYIPHKDMLTPEMMAAIFDQFADVIDRGTFVDKELKDSVMRTIVANAGITSLPAGSRILDVAVGTGWSADFIDTNKYQVIGVDLSKKMVEHAQKRDIQAIRADASFLPFHNNCFSAVICSYGAHWFKDEKPFLEMKRVLAKGGILSFNYHKADDDWKEMRESLLGIGARENLEIQEVEIRTGKGTYLENFLTLRKLT